MSVSADKQKHTNPENQNKKESDKEESSASIQIDNDSSHHSEEEDIAPIRVVRQAAKPMKTYAISREKKKSFTKTSYTFYFHIQGDVKYWAHSPKRHPDASIPIFPANSDTYDHIMLIGNGCSSFSLRKVDSSTELVTVNIVTDASLLRLPRRSVVYIFPEMGCQTFELESKQPSKGAQGHWILNFENKFVIPSVKNTIYCEKTGTAFGGNEMLMMRKIGQDAYEIDASESIPILAVFSIGLALCLSK